MVFNQGQLCPPHQGTLGNIWTQFWLLRDEGDQHLVCRERPGMPLSTYLSAHPQPE